jgi:glyoxylase-like metal-dependent hydrolase (beta-lactamase superfamily II)
LGVGSVILGDLEITPLLDARFRLDGGAMFGVVPKPLWQKRAAADDRNRVHMAMRPLLVRGERLMIVDAGIGDKYDAKFADIYGVERTDPLARTLERAGAELDAIEIVLATHLHFDHAGGLIVKDASGTARPQFPGARYVIDRGEWDDATHPNERNRASYIAENFLALEGAGCVDYTEGDVQVMPGVRVRRTGGHTRRHQVVYLESRGKTAVFAADLIPTTAHVDLPWIMAYDLFPMETLAFKREFLREAIDREYLIFFEHDPNIAAGYIREKDGRPYVEPFR